MINGPDGLTGAVMAVESIGGAMVLLHGPGGCRSRNALLSMTSVPRDDRRWTEYSDRYFAGYSRVPATYIDGDDFVGGAVQKLEEALDAVQREGPELVVVIDSPGASLMADNHMGAIRDLGVSDGAMVLEDGTMSVPPGRAYGRTLAAITRHLVTDRVPHRPGSICLAGITTMDACWQDVADEFAGYLEDMGFGDILLPGAGATVTEMRECAGCEFCAVVCPESADGLISLYSEMGVKVVVPDVSPVGYDATRAWIEAVASATGKGPSRALSRLCSRRERTERKLNGMRYGMMRVHGMTFSAAGPASVLVPLTAMLSSLGMEPASLVCTDGDVGRLDGIDVGASGSGRLAPADLAVCDGNTALRMTAGRRCRASVSTGGAVIGSDGLLPRPIFGANGVLTLLDAVVGASHGR